MAKKYTASVRNIASRPRSKRLQQLHSVGSAASSIVIAGEGETGNNFDSYFGVDASGDIYVRGNRGLYSYSFISSGGSNSTTGGSESGGEGIDAASLWDLLDDSTGEQINPSHLATALSGVVTIANSQTVTGGKLFSGGLCVSGVSGDSVSSKYECYIHSNKTLNSDDTLDDSSALAVVNGGTGYAINAINVSNGTAIQAIAYGLGYGMSAMSVSNVGLFAFGREADIEAAGGRIRMLGKMLTVSNDDKLVWNGAKLLTAIDNQKFSELFSDDLRNSVSWTIDGHLHITIDGSEYEGNVLDEINYKDIIGDTYIEGDIATTAEMDALVDSIYTDVVTGVDLDTIITKSEVDSLFDTIFNGKNEEI